MFVRECLACLCPSLYATFLFQFVADVPWRSMGEVDFEGCWRDERERRGMGRFGLWHHFVDVDMAMWGGVGVGVGDR